MQHDCAKSCSLSWVNVTGNQNSFYRLYSSESVSSLKISKALECLNNIATFNNLQNMKMYLVKLGESIPLTRIEATINPSDY